MSKKIDEISKLTERLLTSWESPTNKEICIEALHELWRKYDIQPERIIGYISNIFQAGYDECKRRENTLTKGDDI